MNEKDLLEAVMLHALKSLEPPLNKDGSQVLCREYSYDDLERYLNGGIAGEEKEAFEHHAGHCDLCLYGLNQLAEQRENNRLIDSTLEYMKKNKPIISFENILEIIAIWKDKLAWFKDISDAAVLQHGLVMAERSGSKTERGKKERVENPQKILKQLDQCGISVEIDIETSETGNAVIVGFSFFDMTEQEFIKGLSVQLVGSENTEHKTDEEGRALFVLRQLGVYDVFVTRDLDKPVLHLNLDLTDSTEH